MSRFGERLRILLEEKEMQGKDFAKIMKVEPPTVSNWLNGNRFPKDDSMLITIAEYFDVTIDYLLGKSNERNPNKPKNGVKISIPTPKDKMEELKDYLVKAGYMKSFDDLDAAQIGFIQDTIERYLKMTNNYKEKGED